MLNEADHKILLTIAEKLTGMTTLSERDKEAIIAKVCRRIKEKNCASLLDYLKLVKSESSEYEFLYSLFEKEATGTIKIIKRKKILIIDDIHGPRTILRVALEKNGFDIFLAESSEEVIKLMGDHLFDLICFDINVKDKNCVSWFLKERKAGLKTPAIILSSNNPYEVERHFGSLIYLAQEHYTKEYVFQHLSEFIDVVKALSSPRERSGHSENSEQKIPFKFSHTPELVLIGASTGGPQAIASLLRKMVQPTPPILVVQHTIPYFATDFARMVALSSGLKVAGELSDVPLEDSCIYIAHGDYHIGVTARAKKLFLEHSSRDCDHGHRPSVDHLFLSVAKHNISCMAVLLTGMGKDGSLGMKKLYDTGEVFTVAQSEESSVIFGMPKEAIALNCVHQVGDLEQIRKSLDCVINKRGKNG